MYDRVYLIVMDGVGCGASRESEKYGDAGANTLRSVANANPDLKLPTFSRLGLGNMLGLSLFEQDGYFSSYIGRSDFKSLGKDSTTGHWEIAGLISDADFSYFPGGFPDEIVHEIVEKSDIDGFIGNVVASGTEIIKVLGTQHINSGMPILYTSADSVLQIAAHEEHFGLERLYKLCEISRKIVDNFNISRVIARPFIGKTAKSFKRTTNRQDFTIAPPGKTLLNVLSEQNVSTASVGKIKSLFNNSGVDKAYEAHTNLEAYEILQDLTGKFDTEKFVFVNLIDFDTLYGHRRDSKGFGQALKEFDDFLGKWLNMLHNDTLIILTADHGCDPSFKGTDHTRECVPTIAFAPNFRKGFVDLRTHSSTADIAATITDNFNIREKSIAGRSFFNILKSQA
ncbi:MAG: phosphopentomutase [Planctomycetes bacterium]|nr:phosphopentomutase [Planctomycetota bacterium]